ncbi:2-oxoglutarate dehydrogenase complex dihydrolipoyllysine-residue succinyltransferase [Candidatus Pelagibacter communis]|uniref:2-oxoglutarate dehydrogenase complex dihydrolipoyllysine-residue succinyltransferase n=1 Tax=Pelagibacter ubique TaxID=198252 RepID=UPI00094DE28A|nr:2-oxoglutarate dehydrogenase complex dihydrolipoyllysine-residue succinyltransferase [Candidatus Pelagibacter ubique]
MSDKIVVPVLGESITEATVAKWLKNKGDSVEADEPVVELETDKVNLEVPSPSDGVLSEINAQNGSTVEVGAVLGSIIGGSSQREVSEDKLKKDEPIKNQDNVVSLKKEAESKEVETKLFDKEEEISESEDDTKKEEPLVLTEEVSSKKEKSKKTIDLSISPAVRKIAADNKIDLKKIQGTGKGGRISKGDLLSLMNVKPAPSERKIKFGQEEKIKMTRLRLTIAKRLKQAQDNAAMLTTFNEVDMSGIIEMRKENQNDFQDRFGIKLGFMSFFVKACIESLKLFPAINAEIEGENIIYKNYYNISFAVGTEKGLVVPVLKNADEMSFADIEKKIKELSDKARDGKITIDDLQGGTFTISNGGVYGSMLSTPILNLPQSGVLGMHNIVERPHVVNGEIKIRPIMYIALSYDHRIIDGKEAVSFLKNTKDNLEDPRRLFLNL